VQDRGPEQGDAQSHDGAHLCRQQLHHLDFFFSADGKSYE
jgi:hypothetical protein